MLSTESIGSPALGAVDGQADPPFSHRHSVYQCTSYIVPSQFAPCVLFVNGCLFMIHVTTVTATQLCWPRQIFVDSVVGPALVVLNVPKRVKSPFAGFIKN